MDCRVGLGGENGCSHGGAVSDCAVSRNFVRVPQAAFVLLALAASVLVVSCTRDKAQATPDASSLLQSVTPADPAKISDLQAGTHWSNPYLVIRPATVGLLSGVDANEEQILKPEEVLKALAQLPSTAWPYGRAVAVLVDAKPTTSEQDKIALRRNRGLVAGELQSAHVAIHWIPSS